MDEFQIVDTTAKRSYIYALLDPDTKKARYVGKSEAPVQRFKSHLSGGMNWLKEKHGKTPPVHKWIAEVCRTGGTPLLAILEETGVGEDKWGPAEERWIVRLTREGHDLLNGEVLRVKRRNDAHFQKALELGRELFDADL